MSDEPTDHVTVSRAELDALRAEVRRLRRQLAREEAKARIFADAGPGPSNTATTFTRAELAETRGVGD